jgi:hypothetical protein
MFERSIRTHIINQALAHFYHQFQQFTSIHLQQLLSMMQWAISRNKAFAWKCGAIAAMTLQPRSYPQ